MQQEFSPSGVFSGLLNRDQLAAQMECNPRTIIRREFEGMPVIKVGAKRLYDPANVRAWIASHEVRPTTPKRGRPAKRTT